MFDAVGGALDAASSMLGGAKKGPAAADQPMTFANAEDLGTTEAEAGGAIGKNQDNVADRGEVIEFIHFGCVHVDDSEHFHHGALADDKLLDKPLDGPSSRAMFFRAAIEREAILTSLMLGACQKVMEEYEASKGGAGAIVGMAADLIGGGGGSKGPSAADLNPMIESARATGTLINVATTEYKNTHKAGVDLHQAWTNYRAFSKKLIDTPPGTEKGAGVLGGLSDVTSALSSVTALLPGIGDIINLIQGIAFKAFDVYLALYLRISDDQEKRIREAARRLTLESITTNREPIFPVWFPKPKPAEQNSQAQGTNTGVGFIDDVTKKGAEAKKGAEDAYKDVKDFFEGDTPECPGTPFLDQAFGSTPLPAPGTDVAEANKPQKTIADLVVKSFKASLKLDSLPDFVETIISEIVAMDAEFVRAIYQKLMERDQTQPIQAPPLYEAARKRLLQKLVNLLIQQVSFLQTAKGAGANMFGVNVRAGKFLDKGEDELNKEFLDVLDPALEICMKGLAEKLEGGRSLAAKEKAATMEVYLGLFPWMLALVFRDTFFPVWDLFVDNTFGQIDGLKDVVKSAKSAMKDMRATIDQARDYATKSKKVYDRATNEGLKLGTGGQNITGYQQDLASTASRDQTADQGPPLYVFPITARLASATAKRIELDEYEAVKPKHKWNYGSAPPPAGSTAGVNPSPLPSVPSAPSLPGL